MRRLTALLMAAMVVAGLLGAGHAAAALDVPRSASAAAGLGSPSTSVFFTDPVRGTRTWAPEAIASLEAQSVKYATPRALGSSGLIRASLFHVTSMHLPRMLVHAGRSGSHVQVLLDGSTRTLGCGTSNCINPAYAELALLNTLGDPDSWLRTCDGVGPGSPNPIAGHGNGCIGTERNHNKFLLVSGTINQQDAGSDIVIQTSMNNTGAANNRAFNNAIVTVNQPAVYGDYGAYFDALVAASGAGPRPTISQFDSVFGEVADTSSIGSHQISTWSYPRASDDPMASALSAMNLRNSCANAPASGSSPHRGGIALAMSQIHGRASFVERLILLKLSGCNVSVVFGDISKRDFTAMHSVGIGLSRLCISPSGDARGSPIFVHSKYMLMSGTLAGLGSDVRAVYTGSNNLDDKSLTRTDDRMMRYVEPAGQSPIFDAYEQNFLHLVTVASHGTQSYLRCSGDD